MSREVDVAIIGAGSAGLYALSQVRKKTDNLVLIEGGELGTTCARVGCMPSKVFIQVAEDFHRKSLFERQGINGGDELSIDLPEAMEHVQDLRDMFVDRTLGVTDDLDEAHLIDGYAKFVSNDTVEVNVVNVEVYVTDKKGNPVSGLTRDDFEIFEDGEYQLRGEGKVLAVVITADKGLCGAFNANIIRTVSRFLAERPEVDVSFSFVGRKGRYFFRRRQVKIRSEHVGVYQALRFETARENAQEGLDEVRAARNLKVRWQPSDDD